MASGFTVSVGGDVGVVFELFLVKSVTSSADGYEWVQYVSPMQHYEPTPILLEATHQLVDAGVLLATAIVLLVGSRAPFGRRDI